MSSFFQLFRKADEVGTLLFQLFLLGRKLSIHPVLHPISTYNNAQQCRKQNQNNQTSIQKHSLRRITRPEFINLPVQFLYLAVLFQNMVGLQLHHAGIGFVHQCRRKYIFFFKRSFLQNVHRNLHHLIATGRINKSSIQHTVKHTAYHLLQSIIFSGQCIHSHKKHFFFSSLLSGSQISTDSHTVILCKQQINIFVNT